MLNIANRSLKRTNTDMKLISLIIKMACTVLNYGPELKRPYLKNTNSLKLDWVDAAFKAMA